MKIWVRDRIYKKKMACIKQGQGFIDDFESYIKTLKTPHGVPEKYAKGVLRVYKRIQKEMRKESLKYGG